MAIHQFSSPQANEDKEQKILAGKIVFFKKGLAGPNGIGRGKLPLCGRNSKWEKVFFN
jgi:hypothetical protein